MDRLEEIRQRTEAATDGPWERFDTPDYAEIHVLGGKEAGFLPVALADEAYNADFIAHSREDISYLLSEVARMKQGWIDANENHTDDFMRLSAKIVALTARAEKAEQERDAAVGDWKAYEENGQCDVCKYGEGGGCVYPEGNRCRFEWRGPQDAGKGENHA